MLSVQNLPLDVPLDELKPSRSDDWDTKAGLLRWSACECMCSKPSSILDQGLAIRDSNPPQWMLVKHVTDEVLCEYFLRGYPIHAHLSAHAGFGPDLYCNLSREQTISF